MARWNSPRRDRRCHQLADRMPPGGLTKDGDVVRVATKGFDVVAHPGERRNLIQRAVVAGGTVRVFCGEIRVGQESIQSQPIVDAYQHNTIACQAGALVGPAAGPELVAAAVNPEHDRQRTAALRGRDDVQGQAVLGHLDVDQPGKGVEQPLAHARHARTCSHARQEQIVAVFTFAVAAGFASRSDRTRCSVLFRPSLPQVAVPANADRPQAQRRKEYRENDQSHQCARRSPRRFA